MHSSPLEPLLAGLDPALARKAQGAGEGWREPGGDEGTAGRTQPEAAPSHTLQALGKTHRSTFSSSSGKQMQLSPVAGRADWGYLFEALSGGCGAGGPRCGEFP